MYLSYLIQVECILLGIYSVQTYNTYNVYIIIIIMSHIIIACNYEYYHWLVQYHV
jgi:hypothetical protein